jgi:hypothetical protein
MSTLIQVKVIGSWGLNTGLIYHVSDICARILQEIVGRRLYFDTVRGPILGDLPCTAGLCIGTTDRSITEGRTGNAVIQARCSNDLTFTL